MIRRITTVPLLGIFPLALVLNLYLLFSVMDGARIVQQVEAAAGRALSCEELYQARSINTYFDLQHHPQGEALYLFGLAWPIWFALSLGIAFGLMRIMDRQKRWRWFPILVTGLLLLLLILYLPTVAKISCAID